ncbi:hypothetical protein ACQ4PT_041996 [Festuca glaucescens]
MAELCRKLGESLEVVDEIQDSNGRGLGALHVAALNGKLEMCEFLIDELNLDVDAAAQHGSSPLICAIYGKAPKPIVNLLLDRGANPNIPSKQGFTVLHVLATKKGPFGIADILLSRGANVDSMSSEGTPLHFAALCRNLEMMEVLLNLVFMVKRSRGQKSGIMPVEIAAIHGRKECVEILFPVTSPVDKFADWSIDGIMQHVKSVGLEGHLHTIVHASFEVQGDAAFEIKDYAQASALYTTAMATGPKNPNLYAKRCRCWVHMGEINKALDDANTCKSMGWEEDV